MKDSKYYEEIKNISSIIKEAVETHLKDNKDNKIYSKGSKDFYTSSDLNIEEEIIYKISQIYPKDKFFSEETIKNNQFKDRTWVIDPIDGTINYMNNINNFCIQLALFEKTMPVLGFIYIPSEKKMFIGIKGEGSFLNNKEITIDNKKNLENSLVTLDDISTKDINLRRKQKSILTVMADEALRIRMYGSTSYCFSLLASGKTGAHIIFADKIWDIIPGLIIATEAGAVTNWDINKINDYAIIASNKNILEEIMRLL